MLDRFDTGRLSVNIISMVWKNISKSMKIIYTVYPPFLNTGERTDGGKSTERMNQIPRPWLTSLLQKSFSDVVYL